MDLTKKPYKKAMEELVKKETGKTYNEFKKETITRAIGELIEGGNATRKEFEKNVLNKKLESLVLESIKVKQEDANDGDNTKQKNNF